MLAAEALILLPRPKVGTALVLIHLQANRELCKAHVHEKFLPRWFDSAFGSPAALAGLHNSRESSI